MRYQDQLVRATQKALDDVCRAAQAVPVEKVDWEPQGLARSVLSQMQEVATTSRFLLPVIRDGTMPEFDEHARTEALRTRKSYDTLDKCIEAAKEATAEFCQAVADFPDDRLEEEMTLPFGGGMTATMADILALPSWNMIYHHGQINYVQLMLGDRQMH